MKKMGLVALALSGSLLASAAYAEQEKSKPEAPTENPAATNVELYPDLNGKMPLSIEFLPPLNDPSILLKFDTDKDDKRDLIYIYKFINKGNKILLSRPFFVFIDKNKNQKVDGNEIFSLKKKSIEDHAKSTIGFYPIFKADSVLSVKFEKTSYGLTTFIQYDLDGDSSGDVIYGYGLESKIGNSITLKKPFVVFFDKNNNDIFETNEEEMVYLKKRKLKEQDKDFESEDLLKCVPKKEWNI